MVGSSDFASMKWFTPYILRGLVAIEGFFNWHPDGPGRPGLYPAMCPSKFANQTSSPHTTNTSASDGPWAPWTHKPMCVTAAADSSVKYCVYTRADYGTNGISIIAESRPMDASVKACNENGRPILHMAPSQAPDEPKPYKVVDVEGKGRGTIATREVRAGETIMTEDVTLLFDNSVGNWVDEKQGDYLVGFALNQLPHPEVLADLHRAEESRSAWNDTLALINGNGFRANVRMRNTAIFPDIARINHDCRANAYMRLPGGTLAGTVIAHRDIAEGEEITMNYIAPDLPYERRRRLLKQWGFECSCAMCSAPAEEKAESDGRRRRLRDLEVDADDAMYENKTAEAIELTEKSFELLREEDSMSSAGWRYKLLVQLHADLGQEEEIEMYQKLSDEWDETYLGGDPEAIARV